MLAGTFGSERDHKCTVTESLFLGEIARYSTALEGQPALLFPSEEWQCPRGHCMGIRLEFRKSSYSAQRQECVEVAHIPANFRKSSHSGHGQDCVEVADLPGGAAIRDSKHPGAGHIPFPASEWTSFLTTALSQ